MEEYSSLPYPYKFRDLEPEEEELSRPLFQYLGSKCCRVGPKGYFTTEVFKKEAANIYNLLPKPDDIYVASYQRSGTTWTQELVWLVANDLDYAKAAAIPLVHRYCFLDLFTYYNENKIEDYIKLIKANDNNVNEEELRLSLKMKSAPASRTFGSMPSPRFVKTHLPLSLLNPKLLDSAKVVYVARDPRDVAVSCYHHVKLFKIFSYDGNFKEFWNAFYRSLFTMTPYFEHVKEAWELRNHPNMLFVFYEELSKDLPAVIRRVAAFLGKELSHAEIDRLCEHLDIKSFRNNASVNHDETRKKGLLVKGARFIREGKTGGWRDYFDEEMTQQAERWIQDNLKNTDLRFPGV